MNSLPTDICYNYLKTCVTELALAQAAALDNQKDAFDGLEGVTTADPVPYPANGDPVTAINVISTIPSNQGNFVLTVTTSRPAESTMVDSPDGPVLTPSDEYKVTASLSSAENELVCVHVVPLDKNEEASSQKGHIHFVGERAFTIGEFAEVSGFLYSTLNKVNWLGNWPTITSASTTDT